MFNWLKRKTIKAEICGNVHARYYWVIDNNYYHRGGFFVTKHGAMRALEEIMDTVGVKVEWTDRHEGRL